MVFFKYEDKKNRQPHATEHPKLKGPLYIFGKIVEEKMDDNNIDLCFSEVGLFFCLEMEIEISLHSSWTIYQQLTYGALQKQKTCWRDYWEGSG